MSSAPATDKRRTERSQVSVSTAFNDTKLRKSPSAPFPRDGSNVALSTGNLAGGTSAAKSPRGKIILPNTISKFSRQSSFQQQSSQSERKPVSPDQNEPAIAPRTPTAADATPVNISPNIGIKIEFVLGLLSAGVLLSLWIYLMTADCYENLDMIFWVKTFAVLGTVAGLFVSVYCCFERSISPSRGLASCLYISFLAMVGGLNLLGGYMATTCICSCRGNALKDSKKEDLAIFILELIGAVCILGIILVASLTQPML